MKKKVIALLLAASTILALPGCGTEAARVSYNLSREADNFNNVRQS